MSVSGERCCRRCNMHWRSLFDACRRDRIYNIWFSASREMDAIQVACRGFFPSCAVLSASLHCVSACVFQLELLWSAVGLRINLGRNVLRARNLILKLRMKCNIWKSFRRRNRSRHCRVGIKWNANWRSQFGMEISHLNSLHIKFILIPPLLTTVEEMSEITGVEAISISVSNNQRHIRDDWFSVGRKPQCCCVLRHCSPLTVRCCRLLLRLSTATTNNAKWQQSSSDLINEITSIEQQRRS